MFPLFLTLRIHLISANNEQNTFAWQFGNGKMERKGLSEVEEYLSGPTEVAGLSEQLLFTWEKLDEQAKRLSDNRLVMSEYRVLLEEMIEEAHRLDGMLAAFKKAIKAL